MAMLNVKGVIKLPAYSLNLRWIGSKVSLPFIATNSNKVTIPFSVLAVTLELSD